MNRTKYCLKDLSTSIYLVRYWTKKRISKDVDILLVYEKFSSKVQDDLTVIQTLLEKELGMFVDLTVLSIEEEKEVSFIDRLKNSYQKLK